MNTTKEKPSTKGLSVPFHVYLGKALDQADVTNVEVARRMGYPKPNVIAMMKNGSMRVPINKLGVLAEVLKVDRLALLTMALNEYDPGLLETIKGYMGDRLVTQNELGLIEIVRSSLQGFDMDLCGDDKFVMALQAIVGQAFEREIQEEMRPTPGVVKRPSKATKINAEMVAMLARHSQERAALYDKLSAEVGAATMAAQAHRRAA